MALIASDIAAALDGLLFRPSWLLEEADDVGPALELYRTPALGFADLLDRCREPPRRSNANWFTFRTARLAPSAGGGACQGLGSILLSGLSRLHRCLCFRVIGLSVRCPSSPSRAPA